MKIVFFGTSNVALPVLEALGQHHEIAAVVTLPDSRSGRSFESTETPVSVLAGEMELKVLKPESVKANDLLRLELLDLRADIFVVVAYGKILPKDIISLPKFGTVNIHFSVLPKYRGASPIQAALLNGDSQTGTTIFFLDEKMDHGPILAQDSVVIDADDNFITLGDKLSRLSAKLLLNTLPSLAAGKIKPVEQDDLKASSTEIITREHGKIDWAKPAQEIYNQFRAFYPWPGIWTTLNGQNLKITSCFPVQFNMNEIAQPGTILDKGIVACGSGSALRVDMLQLAGGKEISTTEFLNGHKDFVGSKLG